MNKKLISLVILASLFGFAGLALADNPIGIPNPLPGTNTIGELLIKIAGGVGTIIAALGTIMIVIAGILYLTSAGDPTKMSKAKMAFFYAIIGIAIGITATTIVAVVKDILGIV